MMAKVIDDGDAADLSADLLAPLDALEFPNRFPDLLQSDAVEVSGRDRHGCIPHVVFAHHGDEEPRIEESELGAIGAITHICDPPGGIRGEAYFHQLGAAFLRHIDAV